MMRSGGRFMRALVTIGFFFVSLRASAADLASIHSQIKDVGPDAKNAASAAKAWADLKAQPISAVVPTLKAFDGASPLAVNWLRSAIDAIVEREVKAGRNLDVDELMKYLKDVKHSGAG